MVLESVMCRGTCSEKACGIVFALLPSRVEAVQFFFGWMWRCSCTGSLCIGVAVSDVGVSFMLDVIRDESQA